MVGIIDFGSQYTQLIARRIREFGIYSEIFSYSVDVETLKKRGVEAVILSGGPGHIHSEQAVEFDAGIFRNFYILGVCYGMQLLAEHFKGRVSPGTKREYGETVFMPDSREPIFSGVRKETLVWMSHWDYVSKLPEGFVSIGRTANTEIAAMKSLDGKIFAVQFHPEVMHTKEGSRMLKNFLYRICRLKRNWSAGSMLKKTEEEIKSKVKNEKIICALSGGVDSSCLAAIIHNVCGRNSLSIFINNGLLRKGEHEKIVEVFKNRVNLRYLNASELFLKKLSGVANPEKKRKIIGKTFIQLFEKEAVKFGAKHLAQGTLYPDVIESISPLGGPSAKIKTH
ncbi:MAG TPA: glutamine-hydrolyzing GMP synthase, partial [bacterium]|nr:glutamine-hydrolyzing GMP synthase [bacterium]